MHHSVQHVVQYVQLFVRMIMNNYITAIMSLVVLMCISNRMSYTAKVLRGKLLRLNAK